MSTLGSSGKGMGQRLLAAVLVAAVAVGAAGLGGCATRTLQQKKTAWYKRHSGGKAVPCPCGH